MIYLRQSTASQEIPLGPFLDDADGKTPETALTIANTDIKVWVTGATTLANKNSGGATHISGGIYYAVLDATDTATIGPLTIFVAVSGALAVKVSCVVLHANVYDVLFGSTAPSTYAGGAVASVTGNVGGNVTGSVGSVAAGGITASSLAADCITAAKLASDAGAEIATAVWASGTRTVTSLSGLTVDTVTTLTNLPSIPANWLTAAGTAADFGTEVGTAVWASGTRTLTSSGSGGATAQEVWEYATRTLTANPGLTAGDVRSAVGLASANLDTQIATLATASSLAVVAGYLDTEIATIQTAVVTSIPATLSTIAGYIDTEVAAIKAKTDQLTFGVTGEVNANVESINTAAVQGNGTSGNKWRGA